MKIQKMIKTISPALKNLTLSTQNVETMYEVQKRELETTEMYSKYLISVLWSNNQLWLLVLNLQKGGANSFIKSHFIPQVIVD